MTDKNITIFVPDIINIHPTIDLPLIVVIVITSFVKKNKIIITNN